MKGSFTSSDKISAFMNPLKTLGEIMGDVGVVLNIDKTEKTINVYALNSSIGTLVYLKYNPSLFESDFEFGQEDERIGVLKVTEFVRYFSIMDDAGVTINFENSVFSIEHDGGALSFRTADPDMIQQAPKTFKGSTWFTEFEIDSKFAKLHKAMNVLANEDCLCVTGTAADGKVDLIVRSSSVDINNFKVTTKATVSQDFTSYYRKDVLQMILKSPVDSIKVSFAERLAKFECKSKLYDLTYYVAKKTQANS